MLVPALIIAAYLVFFVVTFVRSGPGNPFVYLYITLFFGMYVIDAAGWWVTELAAFILILLILATTRRVSLFFLYLFNFFLGAPYGHLVGVPLYSFVTEPRTYGMLDYKIEEFVEIAGMYCALFMAIWGVTLLVRKGLAYFFPATPE